MFSELSEPDRLINMWINQRFFSAAVSGIVMTAIAAEVNHQPAFALPSQTVNQIVKKSAVQIGGASNGSGVIFAEDDFGYVVLTNRHVIENPGDYQITTSDGKTHDAAEIQELPGADLALIYFDTEERYTVVARGNSNNLAEGQQIFIAGYPGSQAAVAKNRTYRFIPENLSGFLAASDIVDGYELIYTGEPVPGMSGSPIVDSEARIIGVYGNSEIDIQTGSSYLYGIPLDTVLKIAGRSGIKLDEGSAPVASVNPNSATVAVNDNNGNAGFEVIGTAGVNNFVIPEIVYTGECPGTELEDQEALFFSNTTTTAPDRRVIITNVTRGLKRDPLPFTDREYEEGQVSEETKITIGSEHDKRNFVVLPGENQFQYEIVQIEEDEDFETILETGSFKATASKEEKLVERNKIPVEETYCPDDAKECESEEEKVRIVDKCPGETANSGSNPFLNLFQ